MSLTYIVAFSPGFFGRIRHSPVDIRFFGPIKQIYLGVSFLSRSLSQLLLRRCFDNSLAIHSCSHCFRLVTKPALQFLGLLECLKLSDSQAFSKEPFEWISRYRTNIPLLVARYKRGRKAEARDDTLASSEQHGQPKHKFENLCPTDEHRTCSSTLAPWIAAYKPSR